MKRLNISLIIVLFSVIGIFNSCNDALDLKNISNYDPADVWNNLETSQFYVNNMMSSTLGGGWGFDGGWSDESSQYILVDAVNESNGTMKSWSYGTVRRINIGLQEAEHGAMNDDDKSIIMGQLQFLRAVLYFRMTFTHGGVPIIKHPQEVDEDLYVFRNTTAECFDFIIEDLDAAIGSKMRDRAIGGYYGGLSKAAAKALKGRVLLYKASPMFNPSNPWGNSYWNDAYSANKTAYNDLKTLGFNLLPSYGDLFDDQNGSDFENDEYILTKILKYPNSSRGWAAKTLRPLSQTEGSTGANQPTWEHVEKYPMLDGSPIGTSSKYAYSVDNYFENRDSRFYENIYYNACIAEFQIISGRRQYNTGDLGTAGPAGAMEDYLRIDTDNGYNRTGFFPKKGIQEENINALTTNNDIDFPFIRLAEVMLNYAEAANETGHMDEALDMLKLIRMRAGIEAGGDGNYGIDASSKEALRAVIQNETAIELMNEGFRFNNMRRWRRLSDWNGQEKHMLYARVKPEYWVVIGQELVAGKDAKLFELLPEDFTYEVLPFVDASGNTNQVLPDTYYFFPIRVNEIETNDNIEQNVGWGGTFDPTL